MRVRGLVCGCWKIVRAERGTRDSSHLVKGGVQVLGEGEAAAIGRASLQCVDAVQPHSCREGLHRADALGICAIVRVPEPSGSQFSLQENYDQPHKLARLPAV